MILSRFELARGANIQPTHYRKRIEDTAGQRDLFTGETRRPAKVQGQLHWITLHNKHGEGTTHVQVDGSGNIHLGPAALAGRNLLELKKRPGTEQNGGNGAELDADRERSLNEARERLQNLPEEHFEEWRDEPQEQDEPQKPEDPLARIRGADGRPVGATTIHVSQLKVDPKRFQYKISGIDPTTGTNAELKKVKQYNPMLGGQLLVWQDPADNETYVINGHHRYELASRSPMGEGTPFDGQMSVYYVNAKDATEARAHGALTNIAEGRGTAVDAAKFLRDTNGTAEDFAKHGVSLTGAIASAALHLKDLSPMLFQKLTNGGMTEGRALAIAKYLKNPDVQDQLAKYIEKRESQKGTSKTFTDGKVAEMARATAAAKPIRVNAGGGMFDDWFDSNPIEQRADIADHIRKHLSSEHRTFREASSARRQGMLEATGKNQLDVEGNKSRAGAAASDLEEFDHRVNAAGHAIAVALDQHAERLFNEPKKRATIINDALKEVRSILAGQSDGVDAGGEGSGNSISRADDSRGSDSGSGVHRDVAAASKFSRFAIARAHVMRYGRTDQPRDKSGRWIADTGVTPEADVNAFDNEPGSTYRDRALSWAKRELAGKAFTNSDTGLRIAVSMNGIRKTLSHLPDHGPALGLTALPHLLEQAHLLSTLPVNDRNVKAWHIFESPLKIDGLPHVTQLKIREDANGHFYYDQHVTKKNDPPYKLGAAETGSTVTPAGGSMESIDHKDDSVKEKYSRFLIARAAVGVKGRCPRRGVVTAG